MCVKKVWKFMHSSRCCCAESGRACETALLSVIPFAVLKFCNHTNT